MVTMKDIAKECNVSISTVSRSLRDEGYVERKIKNKVLKKALDMGYIPNQNARNLKNHKRDTIGIIVSDIKNYFYSIVLEKLVIDLQNMGYKVLITYSFENIDIEAENFKALLSSKVAAIIFTPISNKNMELMKLAQKQRVPVLQLYRNAYPFLDSIVVDDSQGAFLATDYLIKKGYKKVLLFTIQVELSPHRSVGYIKAYENSSLELDRNCIIKLPFSDESCNIIMDSIENLKPDAIIAGTNTFGVETLSAMKKLNLKIHKDIEVIIFDDMDWFDTFDISSISQPIDEIKQAVLLRIIDKINNSVSFEEFSDTKIQPALVNRKIT